MDREDREGQEIQEQHAGVEMEPAHAAGEADARPSRPRNHHPGDPGGDPREGVRAAEDAFAELCGEWPTDGAPHRRHLCTKIYHFETHEAGLFPAAGRWPGYLTSAGFLLHIEQRPHWGTQFKKHLLE